MAKKEIAEAIVGGVVKGAKEVAEAVGKKSPKPKKTPTKKTPKQKAPKQKEPTRVQPSQPAVKAPSRVEPVTPAKLTPPARQPRQTRAPKTERAPRQPKTTTTRVSTAPARTPKVETPVQPARPAGIGAPPVRPTRPTVTFAETRPGSYLDDIDETSSLLRDGIAPVGQIERQLAEEAAGVRPGMEVELYRGPRPGGPTTPTPPTPPTGGGGITPTPEVPGGAGFRRFLSPGNIAVGAGTAAGLLDAGIKAAGAEESVPDWLRPVLSGAQLAGGAVFGKRFLTDKGLRSRILNAIGLGGSLYGANAAMQAPVVAEPLAPAVPPATQVAPVLPPGLIPGTEVAPEEEAPGASPEDIVQGMIDDALARIESGTGTIEDADTVASGQQQLLDSGTDAALQELEDAYGGAENVVASVQGGDPILLQQLAAIDADYQAGVAAIQQNYTNAINMIAGYETEASGLMQAARDTLAADFAAAAGGLEGLSPSTGLTPEEAMAAGVSDTALGGAGVTGAALLRNLQGAAQAQAAVDQLALGTSLAGQKATAQMDQASLEAALAREAMAARGGARTASAQRQYEERVRKEEQAREDRIRIAEIKYQRALDKEAEKTRKQEREQDRRDRIAEIKANAELDLAMKVAGMSASERAAFLGSKAGQTAKIPSWVGERDTRKPDKALDIKTADGLKVTVSDVNMAREMLDANLTSPEATNPTTAFAYWTNLYRAIKEENPEYIAIYRKVGLPASATEMVAQLFPKK